MKNLRHLLLIFILFFASRALVAQQWGLYTLYATKSGTKAYLIDTNSTTYHTWTFSSSKKSAYSTYLVPGDTLVRTYGYISTGGMSGGGVTGGVQKVLWDGTVVWDFQYNTSTYTIHHDICPLPNGNILMISYEIKSASEAEQAGASSAQEYWAEKIIEVHPTGATTGTIVWEWHLWDHLCQNHDAAKDNYVSSIVNNPQLMNINYAGTGMMPDHWHMNGLDYNPVLDQIVLSIHFMDEAYIIDHSTTTAEAAGHTGGNSGKGGDFLYRWGNPEAYGATGTTIFNVIHDAHWVPSDNPNYPGYLCGFHNNPGSNSKVDIWNPPYDGYNYTLTLGQAYAPSTYDYEYTSTFQSNNEGNSQQLPNGNMLVNNSFGSVYEVDPSGNVIWTKSGTNSTHAYRFTECQIRGPVATAGASSTSVTSGTPVTLNATGYSVSETSPSYTYSWSSSPAGFASTNQSPSDSPVTATTYTVTVTDASLGCSATASVTVDVVTGMNEIDPGNFISVYPNPTAGVITISTENMKSEYNVSVFDIYGNQIFSDNNSQVIDLSGFSDGMYFLQIKASGSIMNQKILISR